MSSPSGAGSPPALALALLLTVVPLTEVAASNCADWSARPGWRGQLGLSGEAEHVVASGGRAWVSSGDNVLTVVDVSDPSSPQPSGSVTLPEPIYGLATDGTWLYASTGTLSLLVLDLANPDAPAVVGSVPTAGLSRWPVVQGTSVYLPLGGGGFEIVNVSVPTNPVSVSVASQHAANRVAVSGDRAVTTAGGGLETTFRVWDLSTPTAPVPRGLLASQGVPFYVDVGYGDVVLEGNTAYHLWSDRVWSDIYSWLYWDHGGVKVVDISDPDNPVSTGGGFSRGHHAERLRRSGDLLYVQFEEEGIRIFSGVGSDSVQQLHWLLADDSVDLALDPAQPVAITLRADGLDSWSVAHPEEPSYVEPIHSNLNLFDLTEMGSFGYSLSRTRDGGPGGIFWDFLGVWDLTDPADPVKTSSVGAQWGWGAKSLVQVGNDLYLPGSKLRRASVSAPGGLPSQPEVVGSVSGPFYDGAALGSYLYLGYYATGLTVLDASGPGDPVVVGADLTWPVNLLEVDGSLGVVGMSQRVAVLDLSQPASPTYRGSVEGLGQFPPKWLALSGARAAVSYGETVHLLDLTDPDLPQAVASWSYPGGGKGGQIVGDVLYVGTSTRGCFAWGISDPGNVQPLGVWSTGETLGFRAVGDRLLSFSVGGLAPLLPACGTAAVGVPEIERPPGGLRLAAGPNPFRGGTTIRWDVSAGPGVRLDVLDAAGRRVRRLVTGTEHSGSVTWDGRDGAGRPVAAGVYFLRLEAPDGSAMGKVTRLR